jgi:hypothetical protein
VTGVDRGGAGARIGFGLGVGVARRQPGAPIAEAAVEAGEEAGEVAPDRGGVAVAVGVAPGAEALEPEYEIGRRRRCGGRRLDRERGGPRIARSCISKRAFCVRCALRRRVLRISERRTAASQRGHRAWRGAVAHLPQPAEHRLARVQRILEDHCPRAGVDLARQRVEGLPDTGIALDQQRIDQRRVLRTFYHRRARSDGLS